MVVDRLVKEGRLAPTLYEWPRGYFDIQHYFASHLVAKNIAPDISTSVLQFTSIYRRLYNSKPILGQNLPDDWEKICESPDEIWRAYTANESSVYHHSPSSSDGCHHGSFIYKPYPNKPEIIDSVTGRSKIELHFDNHRGNGKSEFSRSNLPTLKQNICDLFTAVASRMDRDEHFRPDSVTLGSWMNNLPATKEVLPPEFVASGTIVRPPQLSFGGDSLWGQFLTNNGGVNVSRTQEFIANLQSANTLDKVVDAFPIPVVIFRSPLQVFFQHYQIKI
jgi:hypothetical protein